MYCMTCEEWSRLPERDLLTRMKYGEGSGVCSCNIFSMKISTGMEATELKPGGFIRWNSAETGGRFITDQHFGCVHHKTELGIDDL